MTIVRRPGRQIGHEALRDAIVVTAREIMREEGVGGLSLHEVARRLGMKAPSLYTYFESKHALYDEIFRRGMRQYQQELDALEAEVGLGAGAIEAVMAHYMRFATENPELYALLFERPVPGFVPSQATLEEAERLVAHSDERIAKLLHDGVIESGLGVEQTRDLLVALMHGLTSLRQANEPGAALDQGRFGPLVPHAARLLLRAWEPQPRKTKERK